MKKFLIANKKLSFALVAGILTTAIALGGIFAWFTATAGVNEGAVDTAEVGVELANNGAAYLYEWTRAGLSLQREFITGMDAATDLAGKSAYLNSFWEGHERWQILTVEGDNGGYVMTNDVTIDLDDPDAELKVTPGSIIEYVVHYVNTSNIPVYMRCKAPAVSARKESLPPVELPIYLYGQASAVGSGIVDVDVVYQDGYYYFTKPIGVTDEIGEYDPDTGYTTVIEYGDREAWANITAYVDHNLSGYQNGTIDFSGVEVEVIQATNNAPYLAWGTTGITFEPYVAP